jgi:menaquinone-dependent protoporphyrinogen IX oxidase
MKTLIAFASKGKSTEEYASEISKVIRADVIDLRKKKPSIADYDRIIVGSGVRAGKMYSEAVKFLQSDFKGKKVAIFVSTLQPESDAKTKYIEPLLTRNPTLKPEAIGIFGGRMKFLWKTIDKTDKKAAKNWAETL